MAGRRGRPAVPVVLTDEERATLERWARRHSSSQALAMRCRIVLGCADGATNEQVAAEVGCSPKTASKWRNRFAEQRLDGLSDAPRPGAPRTVTDDIVEEVVVDTLESTPTDATHWSTRSLAARHGVSHQTVAEIWRAFGLKPWVQDDFKISPDPQLIEKTRDIVGLYLNPPEAAVVFAVDEKPQIQALDRTAPTLPMLPTTPARATHDYVRHGTLDLFAALDVASGTVITDLRPGHSSDEFVKFLNKINRAVPDHLDVHIVLDNLQTHKTPKVHRWLLRHRRFHLHFTPDLQLLAQPGRTLVLRADHQEAGPLGPPSRQRAGCRHPRLDRTVERRPATVRVDQDRRPDPGLDRSLLRRRPRRHHGSRITASSTLTGH